MTTQTVSTATEPAISRLHVPQAEELTARAARLFEANKSASGYVPNWLQALALGGSDTDRLNAYLFPLLEGTGREKSQLTKREREIIGTIVSVENRCPYCHTLHIDGLAKELGDYQLATRIGLDYREVDELSERERALAELTTIITNDPRDVTDEHLDGLRELGLSDASIFEAIQLAAIINATNRIALALAVPPDREVFAAQNASLKGR